MLLIFFIYIFCLTIMQHLHGSQEKKKTIYCEDAGHAIYQEAPVQPRIVAIISRIVPTIARISIFEASWLNSFFLLYNHVNKVWSICRLNSCL